MTVAGAGALGLSCALALARAGCAVTVLDPSLKGPSASSVAAGMIAPAFETALGEGGARDLDLLLAARNLWPKLAAQTGVWVDRSGALAVGPDAWLEAVSRGFERVGLRCSELGGETLAALAPGLAPRWSIALLTREDWRLDAVQALGAMRAAAEAMDVQFSAARAEGLCGADLLVAATGPSHELAPELAQLQPIKGHILRAQVDGVGRMTVRGRNGYAVPAPGGISVGATMEPGVCDDRVDPGKVEALRAAGAELYPALSDSRVQARTGIRAATPDGLPLVGPSAEAGVLLAAGARRNGWLLAPLVGEMIAAYATGGDPGPFASRLAPGRFGD